jgi:SAM-dependent methyltransferase
VARRPDLATTPGLTLRIGDGRSLPFADESFDIVHASLVIHHLPPDDVVALLAEMRRVARLGVVVNDLLRGRLGHTGAWLLTRLATGNAYTRHDAPLSVRRAYTLPELEALLAGAGLHADGRWFGLARHRVAVAARVPR